MTFHGDCIGPVGAKLYHGACPHTWVSEFTGREYVCSCTCHAPAACPTCGSARTVESDVAESDGEPFAWCEPCAVGTFAGESA